MVSTEELHELIHNQLVFYCIIMCQTNDNWSFLFVLVEAMEQVSRLSIHQDSLDSGNIDFDLTHITWPGSHTLAPGV